MLITFNPEKHEYIVKGAPCYSVTQIIAADHRHSDEWYMHRGTAIHRMVELEMNGDLDEVSLDERLFPYLSAFRSFRVECPNLYGIFDIKGGVPEKWHTLQIAAYRELYCNGLDIDGNPLRAIKTGSEIIGYHPHYGYCGTIDLLLLDGAPGHIHAHPPGYLLYLGDDGRYKLQPAKDINKHIQAFLTLVAAPKVRELYGI